MTWSMGIFIDIILLGVIALNMVLGYKNGLLATVFKLLSWLLALILAVFLCQFLAKAIYDGMLHEKIVKSLSEMKIIKDSKGNVLLEQSLATITGFAGFLFKLGKGAILGATSGVNSNLAAQGIKQLAPQISSMYIRPMFVNIVSIVLFVVIMLVLGLVFSLVFKTLKSANKIPIVGSLNQVGGVGIGALVGIVWALGIVQLVKLYLLLTNKGTLANGVENNSFIFQLFYKFNLFG